MPLVLTVKFDEVVAIGDLGWLKVKKSKDSRRVMLVLDGDKIKGVAPLRGRADALEPSPAAQTLPTGAEALPPAGDS
ncbi:hypothetical protein [Chelatococcus sp. XZ-Ab1]|uniref:hypothetical protein n=1 Tax=Chelatococcus sp. XZ-Ab1 TaxID=3034027 RepID=UPI0023E3D4E1|nr:hypothetical protein [Chelatococcus sp. XZ-Ab1]